MQALDEEAKSVGVTFFFEEESCYNIVFFSIFFNTIEIGILLQK